MTAFGSPNQRALMQQLPTYMILDDHEIEDNWVNGRLWKDSSRRLFNMAIQAYLSYQWVHGPRQAWDGRQNTKFLYYSFECLGFPFFVLDERSQRIKEDEDNNLDDNHLLGMPAKVGVDGTVYNGQLERFCAWLVTQQQQVGDRPKFVVSPSVFAPNELDGKKDPKKSDSWPAFPETRRAVLKTIVENRVQNVVFLGGDVHCSNVTEIDFEGTPEAAQLKAFAITSSAFYWPFPFADGDPNSFVHDSRKEKDGFQVNDAVTMHYKARGFEQDDNFTEVEVDDGARKITIRNIGQKGAILKEDVLRY
jgi:alkaline phosphatase D